MEELMFLEALLDDEEENAVLKMQKLHQTAFLSSASLLRVESLSKVALFENVIADFTDEQFRQHFR
jgi:hypothetical protein